MKRPKLVCFELVYSMDGDIAPISGEMSGYIVNSAALVDFVCSHAPSFIFTISLPPAWAADALASIRHLNRASWSASAIMSGLCGSSTALPQGRSGRSDGHVRPHKGCCAIGMNSSPVTMINFAELDAHDFFFPNWG